MPKKEVIEKEAKGLVARNDYSLLNSALTWDTKLVQINFYYTNNLIETKYPNIHIRIRCTGEKMCLQIKNRIKQEHNYRECIEYEIEMAQIPIQIDEKTLRQTWGDYCFGDVKLLGFLVTERAIKNIGSARVMLDRNVYNGKEDYEIEIECDSIEVAGQTITALELDDKMKLAHGKYERFCQTLNS